MCVCVWGGGGGAFGPVISPRVYSLIIYKGLLIFWHLNTLPDMDACAYLSLCYSSDNLCLNIGLKRTNWLWRRTCTKRTFQNNKFPALKWWLSIGGSPLVALHWWLSIGGSPLVALHWWLSIGGSPLVALHWWLSIGGSPLVALHWWLSIGGSPLVALHWWLSIGGSPLVALHWWLSIGGSVSVTVTGEMEIKRNNRLEVPCKYRF